MRNSLAEELGGRSEVGMRERLRSSQRLFGWADE